MNSIKQILLIVVAFLIATPLNATIRHVPGQFPTIQAAVDIAIDGDTVMVEPGTYAGSGNRDITFAGKDLTIKSSGGRAITIIDIGGTVADRHRWLLLDNDQTVATIIEGFTVRSGYAPLNSQSGFYLGGAVFIDGAGATVRDCIFALNLAEGGGAIALRFAATCNISDCRFENNEANYGGALAAAAMSSVNIANSIFKNNQGFIAGGAVDLNKSTAIASFSEIASNYSASGAAVKLYAEASGTFTNCTIVNNSGTNGSAVNNQGGSLILVRTIVALNSGNYTIHCNSPIASNFICTNIYGNSAGDYVGCISLNYGINGNLSANPNFCDFESGNYALADNSPCLPSLNSCQELIGAFGEGCLFVCFDTDGDTLGDPGYPENTCAVDNCPLVANTDQQDTDHDGQGDACDLCTDPDGDGFGDPGFVVSTCPTDNCPSDSNFDQAETDGDGIGDVCDNCPFSTNVDQVDSDNDGKGNPCDSCPLDSQNDVDNDGLCANVDNCSAIWNPDQLDTDSDGYGDVCDICGDADGNTIVNISDVVFLINWIFAGGPGPCCGGADADCNGILTISDAVYLINYIFSGGATPCAACP